jgi:hypothetical protein
LAAPKTTAFDQSIATKTTKKAVDQLIAQEQEEEEEEESAKHSIATTKTQGKDATEHLIASTTAFDLKTAIVTTPTTKKAANQLIVEEIDQSNLTLEDAVGLSTATVKAETQLRRGEKPDTIFLF